MLKLVKKYLTKQFFRLVFLLILLFLVFSHTGQKIFFVRAFSSQINLFPAAFHIEAPDFDNKSLSWHQANNALSQDLDAQADFSQFNKTNSAFISAVADLPLPNNVELTPPAVKGEGATSTGLISSSTNQAFEKGNGPATSSSTANFSQEEQVENNFDQNEKLLDHSVLPAEQSDFLDQGTTTKAEQNFNLDNNSQPASQQVFNQNNSNQAEQLNNSQAIISPTANSNFGQSQQQNPAAPASADNLTSDSWSDNLAPENSSFSPVAEPANKKTLDDQSQPANSSGAKDDGSKEAKPTSFLDKIQHFFFNSLSFLPNYIFNSNQVRAQSLSPSTNTFLSTSLVFSDFSVPIDYGQTDIGGLVLKLSLAGQSHFSSSYLKVFYTVDSSDYKILGNLDLGHRISNQTNGGYFQFNLPALSWQDIDNLKIKISYEQDSLSATTSRSTSVFLDALWLEVSCQSASDEEAGEVNLGQVKGESEVNTEVNSEVLAKNNLMLEFLSTEKDFAVNQKPNFQFRLRRQQGLLGRLKDTLFGWLADPYKKTKIKAYIGDQPDQKINFIVKYLDNGRFALTLNSLPRQFKPGRHKLFINFPAQALTNNQPISFSQDFTWGVLAFNVNQSVYEPGQTAWLQMAVLDDNGHTLCNANLHLEVVSPTGQVSYFNTANKTIVANPKCGPDNIINSPDYYAYYQVKEVGEYYIYLVASTPQGQHSLVDKFRVAEKVPFAVERIGPTRIYPPALYKMALRVTPSRNFQGQFIETVPASFKISHSPGVFIKKENDKQLLSWTVNWQASSTYELSYIFDAPDISPEFYLFGPAVMRAKLPATSSRQSAVQPKAADNQPVIFRENRQWQVAADAIFDVDHYYQHYDAQVTKTINYDTDGWQEVTEYAIPSSAFTAGYKYLILINFAINNSSTNANPMARVRHGSTPFADSEQRWETRRSASSHTGNGYEYFTVWQAVNGEGIHIDVSNAGGTDYTVRTEGYEAFIINLNKQLTENTDWYYATSSHSGNLPTTWTTDGASLSVNGGGQDWLIVGLGYFLSDSTTADFLLRLNNVTDSTPYSQLRYETEDVDDYRPVMTMAGVNFSGTKTWRVEAEADRANTHDWTESKIFALNLSRFQDHFVSYDTTPTQVAPQDTWVNVNSQTYTASEAGDAFIWSQEVVDVGSNLSAIYSRLTIDGTVSPTGHDDAKKELPHGNADEDAHHNFYSGSLSAGSHTIQLDMNDDTYGSAYADIHNLVAFSLKLAPQFSVLANEQYKSDGVTAVANGGWSNDDDMKFSALAAGVAATTTEINYYLELLDESGSFTTSTVEPSSACAPGTAYNSCSSKIWQASTTVNWYNSAWAYRKAITINAAQVEDDLTGFPVLVSATDSDLAYLDYGGHMASATGTDIVITDSSGTTTLPFEREKYSSSTGEIILWVKTNLSSTTNKTLYLYYGNASASDAATTTGVWGNDYVMVHHFEEPAGTTGSGSVTDSAGNANGTPSTGISFGASGQIGQAVDTSGGTGINCGTLGPSILEATTTISFWLYEYNYGSPSRQNPYNQAYGGWSTMTLETSGNMSWYHGSNGGNGSPYENIYSPTLVSNNQWLYIVAVRNPNGYTYRWYRNGSYYSGGSYNSAYPVIADQTFYIGDGYVNPLNGRLDEFRVANVVRSDSWVATEYNNQANPSNFASLGAEETSEFEGIVSVASIPDRGSDTTGYKWQVLACENGGGCSAWSRFNPVTPNFKVDTTPPTAPGALTYLSRTSNSVTFALGASSTEANFDHYAIYYKYGDSGGVSTADSAFVDDNFYYLDYNGATTTTVTGLQSDTQYWFNIFAIDQAGNVASATPEVQATVGKGGRANTVQFLAGTYSADGTNGQLTDTNYTLPSFNFSLAETDVNIQNAYLVFEAQIEAYNNYSYDHIGYNLAFDTCQEPCTADAFSGSGRALADDNTVLAYRAGESTQVRLLLDVTDEAQLAAYSGEGVNMEAQVGYRIETGSATTSIASARAMLVITYTYNNEESESITNTVIYPLESTASGDTGSRLNVQADDCTLDSNCPTFNYQVDLPEYSSSLGAQRLSQWFQTYGVNDSHNANDVYIDVNIQANGATSSTYVHESALAGTQGVLPVIYFADAPGFSENTAQSLEYHAYCPAGTANYYLLGGEVVETYTASSSVAEKTRTVALPLGVVNRGDSTTESSAAVNVYFPENGRTTGRVTIKKAWLRIISNSNSSAAETLTVATKVGNNAKSSDYVYNYNPGGTIVKPTFTIIHVIPSADYTELAKANLIAAKPVTLYVTKDNTTSQGGVSAELLITYTYTSEVDGYLGSLKLLAGQSAVDPGQSTTTQIARAIFPEPAGTKTLLAGGLLAGYILSDSDGNVPTNDFIIDSNLSTGTPSCSASNGFIGKPDSTNALFRFYKDVSANLGVDDNQSYNVCLVNDGAGDSSAGAKMNAQLIYTYMYAPANDLVLYIDDQYKSDDLTSIPNQAWTDENQVVLSALATDADASTTQVDFYFQVLDESGQFSTSSDSAPTSYCADGTAYNSCSAKIWHDTFTASNFVPWYNSNWLYRKKITINASQVEDDLTDFPVLATTTDSDLAWEGYGGHMSSSTGADLLVTDANGTVLDYERAYYSSSTGAIILWIKTDLSSTTNQDLYLYYGNPTITADQQNPTGVWGDDYVMVYHFDEDAGASTVTDSSGNTSGAPSSGLAFAQTGQIGQAIDFSGGTGINCGALGEPLLTPTTTISFWIYENNVSSPSRQNPFEQAYGGWGTMTLETNGAISYFFGSNGGNASPYGSHQSSSGAVTNGSWIYITAVRNPDGYTYTWYKNGDYLNSGTYDSSYPVIDTRTFTIGDGYVNPLNGRLDEFRVERVARSAGWVKTQYNNQLNPANFVSFSTNEESVATQYYEGQVNITAIPDRGSDTAGYKWQVMACDDRGNCADWQEFGLTPNFKVDATPPTAPGNLTIATTTPTSVTLIFGATTTEANFDTYKIFYKEGLSEVTPDDLEHTDANLADINYNGATTTTITGLESNTQYVVNIWAYDLAGNKTSASEISFTTPAAAAARANSVMFFAGAYSGNGNSGQNSDTNYTFSPFNFRLGEKEVEIRNAYILFEAQFEAYANNSGPYTGYNLAFDACAEPCTADAWNGSGRVLKDDNTVLAYDETSSNQVRLLFDVTDEAQLAAYTGDSANMEAQVGYRIERGSAVDSIASARAMLVITYSYSADNSTNLTKTVIYPLESTAAGDSGTRQSSQAANCTKNSNCPTFNYNFTAPEIDTKLSQWFNTFFVNDLNGATDVQVNVNIQGVDVDSDTYIHECALNNTQGAMPWLVFDDVYGFSPNTAQTLEIYISASTNYLLGGEVAETYLASADASTQTRTVVLPIGVLTNGQDTNTASGSVDVYFPENGGGSGVVTVKKAWLRILSNDIDNADYTIGVATKVGDNSQSSSYAYAVNYGGYITKPALTIIHVIPSSDYSELALANATTPKTVTVYTTNSSANIGGVSAELLITYTYTSETSGYLTSLNLYAGQLDVNGNAQSGETTAAAGVFPETRGTKVVRAAGLLASYLMSDSDGGMPSGWFALDANLATSSPTCANAYYHRPDSINSFAEFFKEVTAAVLTTDQQTYSVCLSNDGAGDSSAGAKMNAVWHYTYQWTAPPSEFTQSDWRWYENADAVQPTTAKATENTAISNINIADILRLRLNVGVTKEDLAAHNQSFKLQYVQASDCAGASGWTDVGGLTDNTDWIGYNNPTPNDGDSLTAALLASSTVAESYEETNPTVSNPQAIAVGEYGEWDFVLYDNNATSSADYCFRLVKADGTVLDDYLSDSYPKLTTAPANTPPSNASNLGQYHNDETTPIPNLSWIKENEVRLTAAATDVNINQTITLYFEFIPNDQSFTTATSEPSGACVYGTAYNSCASKIWFVASSSPGDWRVNPYIGTTSITSIPESANGYKWQVLACDDEGACSAWQKFGTTPNVRIDTTPPTAPGNLTYASSTATSITLNLGSPTTEANFDRYRIFYKLGTAGVSESDNEQNDTNLLYQDYNGATSTIVDNLSANSTYVFNIWAYDLAGNKASATVEAIGTTTSSYTPPTGSISTAAQKTDGSGAVDIMIVADDADNDDTLRAKILFKAGIDCDFSSSTQATIDETDANTTATYGDPKVDNNQPYQVGTTSGWIITSPGANYVLFDWLTKTDIPSANGTYCLGLVVNDGLFDQTATDTKLLIIDNVPPTAPGALTVAKKDYNSVTLAFGSASSDPRFSRYRIFYKAGTSGVTENDSEHDDPNLTYVNYNGATSTTVVGLEPHTYYVFNIWAYDDRGNRASSTEVSVKTNAAPTNISADGQYKSDNLTTIANGDWTDEDQVILKASAHDKDSNDLITFYYEVLPTANSFTTATSVPAGACASSTAYTGCVTKIWALATTTSNLPADWYDRDWLFRKQVIVQASQIYANESGFVVLATTTDSDLATYARDDGYDILFTGADGTTTLPYEREYFNSATGELVAWIKTDISSTTNTVLYMYYGNAQASVDQATTTGVWGNDLAGVWHLGDIVVDEGSQANAHLDSTVGGHNGDQYGNNEEKAYLGYSQKFDGLNDYISIGDINANVTTVSFWLKNNGAVDLDGGNHTILVNDGKVVAAGFSNPTIYVDNSTAYSYIYSKRLTINASQVVATKSGFIVLATTTDVNLRYTSFGGHVASSTGGDIYFTAADGVTKLPYEREKYASSTGELVAWIKTDVSSTTDTIIYMFYGDSTLTADQQNPTGVWGNDYVMVHHFEEPAGTTGIGSVTDSAGNANGTPSAGISFGASGQIGQAVDLSGGTGIDCGTLGPSILEATTTISFWLYSYNYGSPARQNPYNQAYGGWSTMTLETSGNMSWYHGDNGGDGANYESLAASGIVNATGQWFYIVATRNPNGYTYRWYRNGSYYSGGSYNSAYPVIADQTFYIGDGYTNPLNGRLDEFRVAKVVRDSGWVANEYNNQHDVASFITFSSEQIVPIIANSSSWHQIAVVSSSAVAATNVQVGRVGSTYFAGNIDELRLYKTALSQSYIGTDFNNQGANGDFVNFSSAQQVTSYYQSFLVLNIPDAAGYKWQVMACDDDGDCSGWDQFNATTPNFRVDTTPPTAPGPLTLNSRTSNSLTLNFGSQTTEANFDRYRIFYSTSSPVTEADTEHIDSNLAYIDYNGASVTTISNLVADTTYYINIWAYDEAGNKASSTEAAINTSAPISSPGVAFYTKGTRVLYYRVWDGTSWGAEQTGPTLGSGAGDNIRHLRAQRSDDGGKIAVFAKTWDGSNQEWWATVYRYAADDFVNTTQLGSAEAAATNNQLITGCLAALSGGEFFIVRNNNAADGTLVYSWSAADGWTAEGAGPNPVAVLNGCRLVRRPGTDNYLLITYDDDRDVGTAYYYGGSTYDNNSWTAWTQHSATEEDADNYVGEGFFDPSDNTRGAFNFSNSATAWNTQAKFFVAGNSSINYGAASTSPNAWTDDFVHGEFAADPGGTGVAYFVGDDIDYRLSVLKLDITSSQPQWSEITNGTDLVGTRLYQYTNDSQKPYAIVFYKSHAGVVAYSDRTNQMVYYRAINASTDTVDASATAVPGADTNIWTRVRTYKDPNEQEFIALFQNDDIDYAAVFWDGAANAFYSSGNQAWTELVTNSGATDRDDENITFAYAAYNSPPNQPTGLAQYKTDATTTIANQGWTNQSSVFFQANVIDSDTNETLKVYLELLAVNDTFTSTTSEPSNACDTATGFNSCSSKIWLIASTTGDFSVTALTASGTISGLPDSANGYKWQVLACDDEPSCSSWAAFNATTPNFRVDTVPPTAPGALTVNSVTSQTVTLNFGATTTEENFDRYRLFYASSSPVSETSAEHTDSNLNDILFNGASQTTVNGLASSTTYYFNIWAYDLAGNKASATPAISTTTAQGPVINQTSYLFENDDGSTVNDNTSATSVDSALLAVKKGERFNARLQIENNGGDTAANKVYKLQFENQTDSPGTWTDVGASTEISYSLGLSGASSDAITAAKAAANSKTFVWGAWYENTNQSDSFTLAKNEYTELVFALKTNNALLGKTYRLRLYNATDNNALDNYLSLPVLTIADNEDIRYSKAAVSSLPNVESDLTYYFDPAGYTAASADDSVRDSLTSSGNYPLVLFAVKHSNNTDAITVTWNGQSSVAATASPIYLQVYQYGSPNQWVTVASSTTAAADTDFTLTSYLNSSLASYYDTSDWTYWRVYQAAGNETLQTDYFNVTFSAPTPDARQLHYRWRNDDGSETAATWREDEDNGDPTAPTTNISRGENIRLRLEVANLGAAAASNYNYRLEYATSTGECVGLSNWTAVTLSSANHWQIATSSYFANGDSSTAQLANSEGYTFTTGSLVEDPGTTTAAISLNENYYTEIEYVVKATANAPDAATYCFRLTNNGAVLDSYSQYPVLTLAGSTNSAPYFTASPSDNGSASTSPTNYGAAVTFTATANDAEDDDYYLAICKTNSITAGNDGPPSCDGGEWCISDLASSTVEASCDYTTAESAEELAWYAFVCDKHAGFSIAKCSPASQGTSSPANNSPFVINHPPSFSQASTTQDYQDPGGTFTITAFVTDNDVSGGADTLSLYVCTVNSAAPGVGCTGGGNITLCSQTGTTSPNAACSFSTSTPATAGTFSYYAFVFDSHNLAASPNPQTGTYTVNNTPPTLGTLVLNNGNDISLNIRPAETTVQTINTSVTDLNGCASLVSANAAIYLSSLSDGYNCTADDNNCYQITPTNCVKTNCSGDNDTTATFTCTANFKYFAIPTDNSTNNPYEPYNWLSYMRVYDGANYSTATSSGVELITTSALEVEEDIIDFGSGLAVGDNTGDDNATTTVVNCGNSPIDSNLSGTDMTGNPSGTISVDNIKWELAPFNYPSGTNNLTSSGEVADINAPRPTSTAPVKDQIYWGIGIPYGSDASIYTGENTFSVVLDIDDWQ